jgi:hypothetical protein
MKIIACLIIVACVLSSYTTITTAELSRLEIQKRISSGE